MSDWQTTFVMVKPDGVQRGLVGEIISRFERKGLKLVGLRSIVPSEQIAEEHYAVHKERPFYNGLIEFITSVLLFASFSFSALTCFETDGAPPMPCSIFSFEEI